MRLHRPGLIARNSLQTLLVYTLRLLIQLALLFLLARYLKTNAYGEYAAIAALGIGLSTLSSFGLGFVVLGVSARSPAAGRVILAQAVPATLLSATILLPLYFWISWEVIGSTASLFSLGLIGLAELLIIPLLSLLSYRLHGLSHIVRSQLINLLPILLRLAGVIICIVWLPSGRLEIYAFVHSVASIVGLLIAIWLSKALAGLPQYFSWPSTSKLCNGARYAVMNFTAINLSELDKTLALSLLGANETGLYALASRGMATVTLPVVATVISAQPRIFRDAANPDAHFNRLIFTIAGMSFAYGIIAAAILHSVVPPLLEWALGNNYAGIGKIVAMMAIIAPFLSARVASGGILLALGKPLLRSGLESLALVLLITLALVLGPHFGLAGLIGAVLISEASIALLTGGYLWHQLRQAMPMASANDTDRELHPS